MMITHEDAVAAGDKVAIRWTSRGTHQGDFLDVPATSKEIHSRGIDIFHLRDVKIAKVWIEWNLLSDLRQMGAVVSSPAQTA
jgi:predicted ester cyclase